MKTASKAQLKEWLANKQDTLLVNVLPEESFKKKTIPGSINIPYEDSDLFVDEVQKRRQSDNQRVIVFCASLKCDKSRQAASRLEAAGVKNVYAYEEGVEGWFGPSEGQAAA
jgi:rhodanese-related sulfurtransferase